MQFQVTCTLSLEGALIKIFLLKYVLLIKLKKIIFN